MAGEAMSVKEVAQALGCSERWVTELITRGELPARRLGERAYIIDRAALRRFVERRQQAEKAVPDGN